MLSLMLGIRVSETDDICKKYKMQKCEIAPQAFACYSILNVDYKSL